MKIILFLFLFSASVSAEGFYVGGSLGKSNLRYNLHNAAEAAIEENEEARNGVTLVRALGGKTTIKEDVTTSFNKVFAGYRLGKHMGFEAFRFATGKFDVALDASVSFRPGSSNSYSVGDENTVGYTADGNLDIIGKAVATADLEAYGVKFNGYLPVNDSFEVVFGIGVGYAKSNMSTSTSVTANGYYNIDGYRNGENEYNNSGTVDYSSKESRQRTIRGVIPVLSIGGLYNMTDSFDLFISYDVYGIPTTNRSLTTTSVGLVYNF